MHSVKLLFIYAQNIYQITNSEIFLMISLIYKLV